MSDDRVCYYVSSLFYLPLSYLKPGCVPAIMPQDITARSGRLRVGGGGGGGGGGGECR